MEWVETTAKTVDEAKNEALDQLGVAEDDAEIVVLDEPRPGLFGRVRGEARVRARVRPSTPRPKLDRRDRKKKDARDAKPAKDARDDAASSPVEAAADAGADGAAELETAETSARGGGRGRGRRSGRGRAGADTSSDDREESPTDSADDSTGATGSSGDDPFAAAFDDTGSPAGATTNTRSSSGRRRGRTAPRAGETSSNTETPATGAGDKEDMVDAAQVGEEARTFVQGVVDAFGLDGTASVVQDGDDLEVAVDGADLGLLVGPRGSTLQALQELTRVAAQRRLGDHDTRLRVDVGGYRVRRREALSRFAHQVAEQVIAEGAAKRLEPMSSADRKVIHDVLSEVDGVVTRSEGDDPRRCVVIAPATD